jgi:ergothioneine biosynthesis protein EgtB
MSSKDVRDATLSAFRRVREASVAMCQPLEPEAFRIPPMEDVSPPWWNLGHTSWFFVRNVLQPLGGCKAPEDEDYDCSLNSYYAALGPRLSRARRGLLTRPTTGEIYRYRESVDHRVTHLVETIDAARWEDLTLPMTVGIHHEQQHQELFYTEIKNILWQNPRKLRGEYQTIPEPVSHGSPGPMGFVPFDGGLFEFGHRGQDWCWDNELPVHWHYVQPFALADRLVTNREYLEFIEDGGYRQPLVWLDNGWRAVRDSAWQSPLYWEFFDGQWWTWTLGGMRPVAWDEPVCHVSFYEADAFARWKSATQGEFHGVRLPREQEWEHAARSLRPDGPADAFLESRRLHPSADSGDDEQPLRQMFGTLWQWTSSPYEPYPGYRPFSGALMEYNGKFMDNQRVLRGGSCVTPRDHFRISYRNFWSSPTRFQFAGIRLARDVGE